jgi:hypothetical protein
LKLASLLLKEPVVVSVPGVLVTVETKGDRRLCEMEA